MKIRVFLWLLAQLLKLLSVLLLLPGAVAAIYGETGGVIAFAATSSFSLATGMLLGRLSSEEDPGLKEAFALVALG
ncbi:MAG: TrkH family potassium uptake protein, partial [Methanothrix sp.]